MEVSWFRVWDGSEDRLEAFLEFPRNWLPMLLYLSHNP